MNVSADVHAEVIFLIARLQLERVGAKAKEAFPFMGVRCDRVVGVVLERLANLSAEQPQIQ